MINENVIDFKYLNFKQKIKYNTIKVVELKNKIRSDESLKSGNKSRSLSNTEKIKLNLLNEQIDILNDSNSKLIKKNKILNTETNQLNLQVTDLEIKVNKQTKKIEEKNLNKD